MYKPLQIQAPTPRGGGGLVLGNCPQIQSKTKKNGKFPFKNKASPIDFERKFPSVHKSLQK